MVQVIWSHDQYTLYSHFKHFHPKDCSDQFFSFILSFDICLNFSSLALMAKQYNIIIRRNVTHLWKGQKKIYRSDDLLSWKQIPVPKYKQPAFTIENKTLMNLCTSQHNKTYQLQMEVFRKRKYSFEEWRDIAFQDRKHLYFPHEELLSWEEASRVCRSIEGMLPQFASKNHLDIIMALFKLSPNIQPSMEAVFIGLQSRVSNQVWTAKNNSPDIWCKMLLPFWLWYKNMSFFSSFKVWIWSPFSFWKKSIQTLWQWFIEKNKIYQRWQCFPGIVFLGEINSIVISKLQEHELWWDRPRPIQMCFCLSSSSQFRTCWKTLPEPQYSQTLCIKASLPP